LVGELDACNDEPDKFVEEHIVTLTKTVDGKVALQNTKRTKRLVKGKRSKFAMSLAKLAYLKFGRRPMVEANLLVTRKWLVKALEDKKYADLRTADKCLAIDRALFLSFVPTMAYNNMRVVMEDDSVVNRLTGAATRFGKVFSLGRTPTQ
jgi:hypothetical protein